jgi:hypothetical protein
MGLEVDFDIHAELEARDKRIGAMQKSLARLRRSVPRDVRLSFAPYAGSTAAYPASGNLVLMSDGPQIGKIWEMRRAFWGGVNCTAAPAGACFLFASVSAPLDLSLNALVAELPTALVTQTWGTGVWKVRGGQNLWAIITGGTPNTYYTVIADASEYDDTMLMATTNME